MSDYSLKFPQNVIVLSYCSFLKCGTEVVQKWS